MIREIKFFGKPVGRVINGVYIVDKTPAHFMRKFNGFGLSSSIIEVDLLPKGVRTIRMIYAGKMGTQVFESDIHQFIESDREWDNVFRDDQGNEVHDVQKFVPLEKMVRV